jgi:hypothetical protein
MTASVRVSILLFYQRIFGRTETAIRWLIWVMYIMNAAYVVAFTIIPIFICMPLWGAWRNPLTRHQYCWSDQAYYDYNIGLYSVSLALDISLLLMPIWPVAKLHMSLKRKLGALIMFMLGAS